MKELQEAKFIVVAFDGWLNVVQNKIVNVVALIRHPLLLCSVQVDTSLTADKYKEIII
jgi:hypothetical protein